MSKNFLYLAFENWEHTEYPLSFSMTGAGERLADLSFPEIKNGVAVDFRFRERLSNTER